MEKALSFCQFCSKPQLASMAKGHACSGFCQRVYSTQSLKGFSKLGSALFIYSGLAFLLAPKGRNALWKVDPFAFLILVLTLLFAAMAGQFGLSTFLIMAGALVGCAFIQALEARTRLNYFTPLQKIYKLPVPKARLLNRGQENLVDTQSLKEGDVVVVPAGESIPCDGVVLNGTTSVDESILTAEKTVKLKGKGERVVGSSLNRDGSIQVLIDKPLSQHFVPRLLSSVEGALQRELNNGRFKKISWLTALGVLMAALAVFIWYWPLGIEIAFYHSIPLLFLGSLFNLMIRLIPYTRMKGLAQSVIMGVVLGSGEYFRKLAKLDVLFFDKTGTLTKGEYFFSKLYLEKGTNQGQLLSTIFSLESCSDHPLSKGMTTHPWYLEIPKLPIKDFKSQTGLGISGKIVERERERFVAAGNVRFLKRLQMNVSRGMREKIEELESMGETVVACGWAGEVRGILSFVDTLRRDLKPLLNRLVSQNIKPVMITGDHDESIAHLTYAQGLNEIYTRCLPEEKIRKIKGKQEKGLCVGMVASHFDETMVLGQADVGMVLGSNNFSLRESTPVQILGRKLTKVTSLIDYSRKVYKITRNSVLGCLALFLVIFVFTFLGYLNFFHVFPLCLLASVLLVILPQRIGNATSTS